MLPTYKVIALNFGVEDKKAVNQRIVSSVQSFDTKLVQVPVGDLTDTCKSLSESGELERPDILLFGFDASHPSFIKMHEEGENTLSGVRRFLEEIDLKSPSPRIHRLGYFCWVDTPVGDYTMIRAAFRVGMNDGILLVEGKDHAPVITSLGESIVSFIKKYHAPHFFQRQWVMENINAIYRQYRNKTIYVRDNAVVFSHDGDADEVTQALFPDCYFITIY